MLRTRTIVVTIFLCLLFCITAASQNKFKGSVVDGEGKPIPGTSVLLLSSKDSVFVKGAVTDIDGKFILEQIKSDSYHLIIRSVGFQAKADKITVASDIDFGNIKMEGETIMLKEAVVSATKPIFEQQIDRLVINVQNNITTAGGSALDVLERSPGVVVNRNTNTINLNGKNGIVVMINGKVSRQSISSVMQLLSGMNANSIEKIELITNPPSKYEASGNGGIINIQLVKKTDLGTNGSVSVNGGYGQREKAGASISLNHRKDKANLYGDLSYNRDHRYAVWRNDRSFTDGSDAISITSDTYREPISTVFNGRLGLDYQLTPTTLVGGFVTGFRSFWDMDADTDGSTTSSVNPASAVKVNLHERGRNRHFMTNFNITQKLGTKSAITFDLDYLYYKDKNETNYANLFSDDANSQSTLQLRRTSKVTPLKVWVASVDMVNEISKKLKIETGLRATSSQLDNDAAIKDLINGEYVTDPSFSGNSNLKEMIGALYTSANYSIDSKTTLKAGLRFEHYETTLGLDGENIINKKYGNLFPTFFLSREVLKETTLQFSYGRRITRPAYNDLAPFFIFLDPTTYFFGNTSLRPAISDNGKMAFAYKQYSLSFEHTYDNHAIQTFQPMLVEGTDQQVFTSLNLNYRSTTSVILTVPLKITAWWSSDLTILGVKTVLGISDNQQREQKYYRINFTEKFSLPSEYTIEVSGYYQSQSLTGISTLRPYQSINLGVQKKLKNNSTLKFAFSNIFGFNFDYITEKTEGNYYNHTRLEFEKRIFNLSYTYNFGNQKLKVKRNRSTGSEEIKNRRN